MTAKLRKYYVDDFAFKDCFNCLCTLDFFFNAILHNVKDLRAVYPI